MIPGEDVAVGKRYTIPAQRVGTVILYVETKNKVVSVSTVWFEAVGGTVWCIDLVSYISY